MAWLDDYWILLDDFSWKRRFTLASWDTHCRNAVAPELRWTKKITRVSAKNDAALLGCFTRAQIHCLLIICSFIHGHFKGIPCTPRTPSSDTAISLLRALNSGKVNIYQVQHPCVEEVMVVMVCGKRKASLLWRFRVWRCLKGPWNMSIR